jgi:DMSO/TMAO reductase YedYZ molybdopterin-dependent catalytic subunit
MLMLLFLAASAARAETPSAPAIAITGAVEHSLKLSADDLARLPATTETVFLHTGHGVLAGGFSGVLLWTLLQQAGVRTDPAIKNDIVRHSVVVTGRDGYGATLSLGEIAPEFGGDQAMIATAHDGTPLAGPDGFARLIVPGDKAAGRAVENIATIEVK